MSRKSTMGAALALALFALVPAHAEDDDTCKPIIDALKKYGDAVMKADPKTPPAMCAAFGQIAGLSRAMREVADQCMEEGAERDALMKDMEETGKVMLDEIDKQCK